MAKAGSDIFQCFDAVLKLLDSCSFFLRMQTSVGKLEAATAELKRRKRAREREADKRGLRGEREATVALSIHTSIAMSLLFGLFLTSIFAIINSKMKNFNKV